MDCKFVDCCIGDDYWVECENCGTKIVANSGAREFNKLGILCDPEKRNSEKMLSAIVDKIKGETKGKNTSFQAKIIEMGDNEFSDIPQLYIQQKTGNRIVFDTNRDFLIDLVRGKGDTFTVYDEVMVTLTITKD